MKNYFRSDTNILKFLFQIEKGQKQLVETGTVEKKEEGKTLPKSNEELAKLRSQGEGSLSDLGRKFGVEPNSINVDSSRIDFAQNNLENAKKENIQSIFDLTGFRIENRAGMEVVSRLQRVGMDMKLFNDSLSGKFKSESEALSYLSRLNLMNDASLAILSRPEVFKDHLKAYDPEKFGLTSLENLGREGENKELSFDSQTQNFLDKESGSLLDGKKDFVIREDGSVHVGKYHENLAGGKGVESKIVFGGTLTFEKGKIVFWDRDTGHFSTSGSRDYAQVHSGGGPVQNLDQLKNLS